MNVASARAAATRGASSPRTGSGGGAARGVAGEGPATGARGAGLGGAFGGAGVGGVGRTTRGRGRASGSGGVSASARVRVASREITAPQSTQNVALTGTGDSQLGQERTLSLSAMSPECNGRALARALVAARLAFHAGVP